MPVAGQRLPSAILVPYNAGVLVSNRENNCSRSEGIVHADRALSNRGSGASSSSGTPGSPRQQNLIISDTKPDRVVRFLTTFGAPKLQVMCDTSALVGANLLVCQIIDPLFKMWAPLRPCAIRVLLLICRRGGATFGVPAAVFHHIRSTRYVQR